MKWEFETFGSKINEKSKWHTWFAWYPVFITQSDSKKVKIVWLEKVKKKAIYNHQESGGYWFWEYREINIKRRPF